MLTENECPRSTPADAPEVPDAVGPSAEAKSAAPEPALPPLTAEEFRGYNRLAVIMDQFVRLGLFTHPPSVFLPFTIHPLSTHEHFRQTWNVLYTACTTNKRPARMSLRQFLDEGLSLVRYLTAHHNIEENFLYPILARNMPSFRAAQRGVPDCKLVKQHRAIHKGMDEFEAYLRACKSGETELELRVLKEKMDAWGEVLFTHLDEEVEELGAENMRKYWTLAEVKAIPV
ncbi:hypothetical protein B0T14DRAFT_427766 [Immersiella caudata]|uniref:Hemerythrin-like domain-containing protein n=1 Tax=Immersiella caudata TaxID=314043 RepID=A0AA39WXV7_9PEZI|nr:hypothetical protein B0T14DRAFT_427766 [Immersiella caudata]